MSVLRRLYRYRRLSLILAITQALMLYLIYALVLGCSCIPIRYFQSEYPYPTNYHVTNKMGSGQEVLCGSSLRRLRKPNVINAATSFQSFKGKYVVSQPRPLFSFVSGGGKIAVWLARLQNTSVCVITSGRVE